MEMYKATWENHIRVLTEAVDDITSIDDFLGVSGVPLSISSFLFEIPFFTPLNDYLRDGIIP